MTIKSKLMGGCVDQFTWLKHNCCLVARTNSLGSTESGCFQVWTNSLGSTKLSSPLDQFIGFTELGFRPEPIRWVLLNWAVFGPRLAKFVGFYWIGLSSDWPIRGVLLNVFWPRPMSLSQLNWVVLRPGPIRWILQHLVVFMPGSIYWVLNWAVFRPASLD